MMEYIAEIFYAIFIFVIGFMVFKHDVVKKLGRSGIIEKDFSRCYILKYPKKAEFHNKDLVYEIDVDEFFELNPKLKGKIEVIERPEIDTKNPFEVRKEIEERKEIHSKFSRNGAYVTRIEE